MDTEKWIIKAEKYRAALISVRTWALSEQPSEELEDAQADLRRIYEIATEALDGPSAN